MSYRKDLGSGIYLDGSLDFQVDSDGDIQDSNGVDELEKDLALQGIIGTQQYLGNPPSRSLDETVRNELTNRFEADQRVENVQKSNIVLDWDRDRKGLKIEVPVRIDGDLENLVMQI